MKLAKWNTPNMVTHRDEFLLPFDSVFDEFFKDTDFFKSFGLTPFQGSAYPKVNVMDYNDKVVVEAELAGYNKEDVSVKTLDGILVISGEAKQYKSSEETVYLRRELKRSKFSRSFSLGTELDGSKVEAIMNNGLLTITIPKKTVVQSEKYNEVEIK